MWWWLGWRMWGWIGATMTDQPTDDLCSNLTAWADVLGGSEASAYREDDDAMGTLADVLRAAHRCVDRLRAERDRLRQAIDEMRSLAREVEMAAVRSHVDDPPAALPNVVIFHAQVLQNKARHALGDTQ